MTSERNKGVLEFIERVAEVSENVSFQAGVGGMETAGGIISYLAEHPERLDDFMLEGFFALPTMMHRDGRLTWHGMNGKIVSPEYSRRAALIGQMQKGNQP